MMMPNMSKKCRKPRARKPVEALIRLGVPFIQEGISLFLVSVICHRHKILISRL